MKKEFLLLSFLSITLVIVYFIFPNLKEEADQTNKFNSEDKNFESYLRTEETYENLNDAQLSFDLVRISQEGDAVMAGKSEPNKKIKLFDGQDLLAEFESDANGEWIWLSEIPLKSGIKKFKLKYSKIEDSRVQSGQTIIVFVDKKDKSKPKVVKFFNDENGSLEMLNLDKVSDGVTLDFLNYSSSGLMIFSGRTSPNTNLEINQLTKKLGETKSDETGKWKFVINYNQISNENISIETIINGEKAILSFSASKLDEKLNKKNVELNNNQIIVKKGNSLWRIARKTLGGGIFYTEIYKNNYKKIKNPHLIFPGQVFNIPFDKKKVFYE